MDFVVTTVVNSGVLHVMQSSVGSFTVARGLSVPSSFHAKISDSGGRLLFDEVLRPGTDCDASFSWNGTALLPDPFKI